MADISYAVNAAFAMGNIQITTSIGSEVVDPRVNLPKAMRRVFWRIFFFVRSLNRRHISIDIE